MIESLGSDPMADSNDNPTLNSPPTAPTARPARARAIRHGRRDRRRPRQGDPPDRRRAADGRRPAEAAMGRRPRGRARGHAQRLRPEELRVASHAPPRSERTPSTRSERGPGGQPGPRTGKVIGIRGKSIFVDLGGKSEGVLPLEQFEGDGGPRSPVRPSRSSSIGSTRTKGVQLLRLKGAAIEATGRTSGGASSSRPG